MDHAFFTIGKKSWSASTMEIFEDGNIVAEHSFPSMFSSKANIVFANETNYSFHSKSMFDTAQVIFENDELLGHLSTKNFGSRYVFFGPKGEFSIIPKNWGREFTILDDKSGIEIAKVSSKTKGFNTTYGIAIIDGYEAQFILVIFLVALRVKAVNEGTA